MPAIISASQLAYLKSLRKESDGLLLEMESFASQKRIPILDWKSAEFLEMLIGISDPKHVLEIGMAIGYSTIRIARILCGEAKVEAIEKSKNNLALARNFIGRAGMNSRILIYEGDALQIIPTLKTKFDFIFLDADKEDYEKLLELSLPVLKKGGIIFIDNLLWHGFTASKRIPKKFERSTELIRRFNKFFLECELLDSTIYPIGDGIGIGIKK